VRGTLAKPLFTVTSVPTMPRERQLAWLVLGHDLEATGSGDERAMLANAALSLGLTGTDFIAQNLRGRLGIDEISIGADAGDESSQARFTIGKYLSPKLYVSYGVGIFQPGNVFKLLYDLGHGFKLSTESGVVTGGDLLYTVETGKPAKVTPATATKGSGG
jgi:translocation and assembly module TamB